MNTLASVVKNPYLDNLGSKIQGMIFFFLSFSFFFFLFLSFSFFLFLFLSSLSFSFFFFLFLSFLS